MLSLLSRVTHHLQSPLFTPSASAPAVLGRVYYSSAPKIEWTPTHQYANKYSETQARRIATDPEYPDHSRARRAKWLEINRDKYNAQRRQYKEKAKLVIDFEQRYWAPKRFRWASDHHYRQRESLRFWIARTSWVRDLDWPTHKPVYSEKILRRCAGCGSYRHLRLWWQDKKADDFLCHSCFTSDWSRALPLGHEDKVFGPRRPSESKPGSTTMPES